MAPVIRTRPEVEIRDQRIDIIRIENGAIAVLVEVSPASCLGVVAVGDLVQVAVTAAASTTSRSTCTWDSILCSWKNSNFIFKRMVSFPQQLVNHVKPFWWYFFITFLILSYQNISIKISCRVSLLKKYSLKCFILSSI